MIGGDRRPHLHVNAHHIRVDDLMPPAPYDEENEKGNLRLIQLMRRRERKPSTDGVVRLRGHKKALVSVVTSRLVIIPVLLVPDSKIEYMHRRMHHMCCDCAVTL